MVIDEQAIVAERLRRRTLALDLCRIIAEFDLLKQDAVVMGGLLHDLIKAFVQRAAGDRPKAVPVFLRVSRSRMRIDCFHGPPFFDNREMIRPHRVL